MAWIQGAGRSLGSVHAFGHQPTWAIHALELTFHEVLVAIVFPIVTWMAFLLCWVDSPWIKGVKLNFSLLSSSGECNVQSHFKWNVLGGKSLCNAALVSHCLRDSSLMLNAKGFMPSKTDPERMKELPLYTFITLLALKFFFLHPGISSVCVSFHRTNFSNGNPPGVIVLGGVCLRKIDGHTFSDTLAKDSLFLFMHL